MLEKNLREMMYPFTALKLKETAKLKMKEILFATKNFGARNLLTLSSIKSGNYLKMSRIPDGPTFTFKIEKYSLNNDLQKFLPRNKKINPIQLGSPLVLCKGFDNYQEIKQRGKNIGS